MGFLPKKFFLSGLRVLTSNVRLRRGGAGLFKMLQDRRISTENKKSLRNKFVFVNLVLVVRPSLIITVNPFVSGTGQI